MSVSRRVPASRPTTSASSRSLPEERRRGNRQVRPEERLERREVAVSELVDALGSAEVLEAMLAEVASARSRRAEPSRTRRAPGRRGRRRRCGRRGGRRRRRSPPRTAAASPCAARCARGSAPKQARSHLLGRRDRARGRREGDEERVALGVDLDAAVARAGLADHTPMLGQRFGVSLGSKLVQELRRALDVGEEERDGAGREVAHRRTRSCVSPSPCASMPLPSAQIKVPRTARRSTPTSTFSWWRERGRDHAASGLDSVRAHVTRTVGGCR